MDDEKEALLALQGGDIDGAFDAMGWSYEENDLRPKEKLWGLTPEALDACETRQDTRDAKEGEQELDHDMNGFMIDGVATLANKICGFLPDAGAVLTPLGLGVNIGFKPQSICNTVTDGIATAATFANDKIWEGWQTYKFENDARDQCGDFTEGMMFKVYCDLHCIEDAVVNGQHAILKSLKTQEKHLVTTVDSIVQHYTGEVFEKLKESQLQANHNSRQLTSIMDNYFGQVLDTSYTYANALTNQLNVQVNALNKNLGDAVVPPMMTLQKHIITVNENLQSLNTWLSERPLFANEGGDESLLELDAQNRHQSILGSYVKNSTNASMSAVQHALGQVAEDTTALIAYIHSGERSDKSINPQAVTPVMDQVVKSVQRRSLSATKAMSRGNAKWAHKQLRKASRDIRLAQAMIQRRSRNQPWEAPEVGFQRKAQTALYPAHRRLRKEFGNIGTMHMTSLTFRAAQKTLMENATSLSALSEQVELGQAISLLMRFEDVSQQMHRTVADYMDWAWLHLDARNKVLQELQSASASDTCNTESTLDGIGERLVHMDTAESNHVKALTKAWRDTAFSLTSMVNLLVDGGLLVHFMRLSASNVKPQDGTILEHHVHHSVNKHGSMLVQQVSKAFDMSQILSNMYSDGMMDTPQDELMEIRSAWARLKTASRQLRRKLKAGGELHQGLLLLAARGQKSSMELLQSASVSRDMGDFLKPLIINHKKAKLSQVHKKRSKVNRAKVDQAKPVS